MQVALAWLLQRSPNILLTPGTSPAQHLRENLQAATLALPSDALAKLEAIGTRSEQKAKKSFCYRSDGIHRFRNCTGINRRRTPSPRSRSLGRKRQVARRGWRPCASR